MRSLLLRRLAVVSAHTSPLDQPGRGDAGGLNVYVAETSRRLAQRGVDVDIFTRATTAAQPDVLEMSPGVSVHHVESGPRRSVAKEDLPAQLCAFAASVLREQERGGVRYDLVHSHYWLSGEVAALLAQRWRVPLVHTPHTLARVKNAALAPGQVPEPAARIIGEEHLTGTAETQVVNSRAEREALVDLYGADPATVSVVHPGVDTATFHPGSQQVARTRAGLSPHALVVLFVGRIQPLKAPGLVVDAARELLAVEPQLRELLSVVLTGGPSGAAAGSAVLADDRAGDGVVRRLGPVSRAQLADLYRAADVLVMPSRSESFGLVALEAQACGTPVVARRVGGLSTAVADGISGVLVDRADADALAHAIRPLLLDAGYRARLSTGAVRHARQFPWEKTTTGLLSTYRELLQGRQGSRVRVGG